MATLRRDITSPRLLVLKAALFLTTGLLATTLVAIGAATSMPWYSVLGLHFIAVWAFCRAYYLAFYVIQKYVDPGSRYAGLAAAARRCWSLLRAHQAPR